MRPYITLATSFNIIIYKNNIIIHCLVSSSNIRWCSLRVARDHSTTNNCKHNNTKQSEQSHDYRHSNQGILSWGWIWRTKNKNDWTCLLHRHAFVKGRGRPTSEKFENAGVFLRVSPTVHTWRALTNQGSLYTFYWCRRSMLAVYLVLWSDWLNCCLLKS